MSDMEAAGADECGVSEPKSFDKRLAVLWRMFRWNRRCGVQGGPRPGCILPVTPPSAPDGIFDGHPEKQSNLG
jgi:hypothetical protein